MVNRSPITLPHSVGVRGQWGPAAAQPPSAAALLEPWLQAPVAIQDSLQGASAWSPQEGHPMWTGSPVSEPPAPALSPFQRQLVCIYLDSRF